MKQNSRLGFRSLLAAATLLAAVSPSVRAAELNFTANDLGNDRFVTDIYTPTGAGLGQGNWYYNLQPINTPVLSRDFSNTTQQGSINFLGSKNGDLVYSITGVAVNLTVRQGGTILPDGTLVGATIPFIFTTLIPNVEIVTYPGFSASYNLKNPENYAAVLGLNGVTVNATAGKAAVYTDNNVQSTVNLAGTNRINGATLATQINIDGTTTFNGNVAGAMYLSPYAALNFTGQATQIYGDITELGSAMSYVSFGGGNTVNGDISMNRFNSSVIDINGSGVVFNGASVAVNRISFTTGGSLALSNGVQVDANINFQGNNATLTIGNGSIVNGSLATGVVTVCWSSRV